MSTATLNTKVEGIVEALENEVRSRSVVPVAAKIAYREKATAAGRRDKAAYRSCDDWMARQLMKLTLSDDKKRQLSIAEFEALLDANGVDHSRLKREGNGWQGRLRMTGGKMLRTRVAKAAIFVLADGTTIEPPKAWCMRNGG